jgi:hypothetical protein
MSNKKGGSRGDMHRRNAMAHWRRHPLRNADHALDCERHDKAMLGTTPEVWRNRGARAPLIRRRRRDKTRRAGLDDATAGGCDDAGDQQHRPTSARPDGRTKRTIKVPKSPKNCENVKRIAANVVVRVVR